MTRHEEELTSPRYGGKLTQGWAYDFWWLFSILFCVFCVRVFFDGVVPFTFF